MERYYFLLLINLIVLSFIFLISKSAIARNTRPKINLTAKARCDRYGDDFSRVSEDRFQAKSNLESKREITETENTNKDLPQASIWWAAEQFDPFGGNLIQNWLTHPQKQQINVTVNWQLWTLLDYFGRYRFVNQFGTVVRKYGYSLKIFNHKNQCLATYKYNAIANPPKWELYLETTGRDSLELEPEEKSPENNPI